MERIGFIGLGAMGAPMAWNLADAGFELCVHNRTAAKMEPFSDAGIATADSPAGAARDADAVVTMVTGPEALQDVALGTDGVVAGLSEDAVVINSSTVSREATIDVETEVSDGGGRFVDAPVLGTVGPAERGELLVLVGADTDVLAEVQPVLRTFGEFKHVGDVGDGTAMKLTTNLLLGVLMEGFSEALVFADGQNLPLETVLDVIQDGVLGAPLYDYKAPLVKERDFEPRFPVELLFKDLNLALAAAGETDVPLPATASAREAMNATRALGYGDEDMMALLKHLETITGRTVGQE